VTRRREGSPERHAEEQDDAGAAEGGVTSALLGLRGSAPSASRSAGSRRREEAALAEAAAEEPGDVGREALSCSPDSDPELLEEDGKGGLADASRHRRGTAGALAPFVALPHPLLRASTSGGQTRAEAVLNLVVNLLGPGILTMPRAVANVGVVPGIFLMTVVAVANRYTLLLVLWMSETMLDETSLPEMGRHVFGQAGLLVVMVSYLLLTGGMMVAYLVIVADILGQLLPLAGLPRLALVAAAAALCLPGAVLKSLRHSALLGIVCAFGVVALVTSLLGTCIMDVEREVQAVDPATGEAAAGPALFRGGVRQVVSSLCLFAVQFSVQAGGIELLGRVSHPEEHQPAEHSELEEAIPHHGHEAYDLAAALGASGLAFGFALVACGSVGFASYGHLGETVHGNVLLSLGVPVAVPMAAVRVLYLAVVVASFAFLMVPCRCAALDLLQCRRRVDGEAVAPAGRDVKVTSLLLALLALVALKVPDLAQALEFVGAWATMVLAFLLPCGFLIELRRRTENLPLLCAGNALPLGLIGCALAVMAFSGCSLVFGLMASFAEAPASGATGDRTVVQDLGSAVAGRSHGPFAGAPAPGGAAADAGDLYPGQ